MTNDAKIKNYLCVIIILLILGIIAAVVFMLLKDKSSKPVESPVNVVEVGGDRTKPNPFHYAESGDWEMLEITPVLKEDKYVSSRIELASYLVKEVPAGTILRITAAHGRWKEVYILEDGKETLFGWVDAEKAPGRPAPTTQPATPAN